MSVRTMVVYPGRALIHCVVGVSSILLVLAGCAISPVGGAPRSTAAATPAPKPMLLGEMFTGRGDIPSSQTTTVAAFDPQSGSRVWQVIEPGGPRGAVTVLHGTAYVLTDVVSITHAQNATQISDSARLTALNAMTGASRWQQSVPPGSPTLVGAAGSTVFTEQFVDAAQPSQRYSQWYDRLTAFAADSGVVQWTKSFPAGINVAPIAVTADALYVCTHEGATDANSLSALRLSDGSAVWTAAQGLHDLSYLGLVDNDTLYFGQYTRPTSPDGQGSAAVLAFSATTGSQLWKSASLPGLYLYPVAAYGTTLYVLATSGYGSNIKRSALAFDIAKGQKIWQSATDPYIADEAYILGLRFGVADANRLYFSVARSLPYRSGTPPPGTTDAVIALDATTGAPAWKTTFPQPVSQPMLYNGTLYVWSTPPAPSGTVTSGVLLALDPATGTLRWQVAVPGAGAYPLTVLQQ